MGARARACLAAAVAVAGLIGEGSIASRAADAATTSSPPRTVVGDFNGDGFDDVLVYRSGIAPDALRYGTPYGFVGGPSVTVYGDYLPVVGEFDGDGKDDVLWYDPAHRGRVAVWYGRSAGFARGPLHNGPVPTAADLFTPVAGDFDNDGTSDIAWANVGPGPRNEATGSPIWYGGHGDFPRRTTRIGTVRCLVFSVCSVAARDFNGDGFDDLAFYRSGMQPDKLVISKGNRFVKGKHIAVNGAYSMFAGDFDGDGLGDLMWYGPGGTADYMWYGRVRGFNSVPTTVNGTYMPLVGDFDGDGNDDIVWYAPGTASDYLRYGKATLFRDGPPIAVNGTYAPAVGDFNGDSRDDIVWVAPDGHDSPVWFGVADGFARGAPVAL